jgi:hypothetical protein
MDTFCIPVECKGYDLDLLRRTLKEKAIAFMTPIMPELEESLLLTTILDVFFLTT